MKGLKVRAVIVIVSVSLLIISAGCAELEKEVVTKQDELKLLKQEKSQLESEFEKLQWENEDLKNQIKTLAELSPEIRLENLYNLQNVRLARYTNLFDKNKDDKKEKLIVYLQPVDKEGDIVKAAGAVDVQLWDLSKSAEKALLGQWRIEPDKLKKLWFSTLIGNNYRLTFDVGNLVNDFQEPLTVKVTFTDYLTGKVFKLQKAIKP